MVVHQFGVVLGRAVSSSCSIQNCGQRTDILLLDYGLGGIVHGPGVLFTNCIVFKFALLMVCGECRLPVHC